MKQNDSKYHQLYLGIKDAGDFISDVERTEFLKLIKELYVNHQEITSSLDDEGKYGISFKTVGEDSKWSDHDEQFFQTESKRDKVYDDWINDRYWDEVFDDELEYSVPKPNIHDIVKIFKEGDSIYDEKGK